MLKLANSLLPKPRAAGGRNDCWKNELRVLMLSLFNFFLKLFLYMLCLLNKSGHLSLLSVCRDGFSCI